MGTRPLGVWLIAAFMALNVMGFGIKLARSLYDAGGDLAAVAAPWGVPRFSLACGLIALVAVAALQLVRLKRTAVPLFVLAALTSLSSVILDVVQQGVIASRGYAGAVPYFVPAMIYVMAMSYTWKLSREGTLR